MIERSDSIIRHYSLVIPCSFTRLRPLAKKTASLIKEKKLMNVEHRTPNIEHRIGYSVYLNLIERSESTIRQSTFDIRHSSVVSHEVSGTEVDPLDGYRSWIGLSFTAGDLQPQPKQGL